MLVVPNRDALASWLPWYGRGAELGVLRGDFSEVLLREAKPIYLALVDHWHPRGDTNWDNHFEEVKTRFSNVTVVNVIRASIEEWAQQLTPDDLFHWMYLDTSHRHSATLMQLYCLANHIRVGGFLCGHDYCIGDGWGAGVIAAVQTFLESNSHWKFIAITEDTFPSFALQRTA